MAVIKKWSFVAVVILAITIVAFMTGCSGPEKQSQILVKDGAGETAAEAKETVAEAEENKAASNIKGEIFDSEKFSILVPAGWEKINSSVSVAFYTGNNLLEISITGSNVTESDAKQLLTKRANQKGGTPLEEVTMFGVKFFKTSYSESELDMTVYSGARNGEQVQIATIEIKDHPKHKEIIAMLESIKLK